MLKQLKTIGYSFPKNPKVLFITALNSIQLSLLSNVRSLGITCHAATSDNISCILKSNASVFFIGPEVFKRPDVTKALLKHRDEFVLKIIDEFSYETSQLIPLNVSYNGAINVAQYRVKSKRIINMKFKIHHEAK